MIQEPLTSTASSGGLGAKLKICYCAIATAVLTHLVMMIVLLSIESSTNHWSTSGLTYCIMEVSEDRKMDQGSELSKLNSASIDAAIHDGCTLVGGISSYHFDGTEYETETRHAQAMMCPEGATGDYCL